MELKRQKLYAGVLGACGAGILALLVLPKEFKHKKDNTSDEAISSPPGLMDKAAANLAAAKHASMAIYTGVTFDFSDYRDNYLANQMGKRWAKGSEDIEPGGKRWKELKRKIDDQLGHNNSKKHSRPVE